MTDRNIFLIKPFTFLIRLRIRGGERTVTEEEFKELIRKLIEQYQLTPQSAYELLQRIVKRLVENQGEERGDPQ